MSRSRTPITAGGAAPPRGPYSQAIQYGDVLYCSGVLGTTSDGELVTSSLQAEAAQCLDNLEAVCAGAGTSLSRALKLTVYLTQMADFPELNAAFAERFGSEPPARATVGVKELLGTSRVEIDAVVACDPTG